MPQNPFLALIAKITGTTTPAPLIVDASTGALLVSSASGDPTIVKIPAGGIAAGAGVAGALLDGSDVTQGAVADAAWTSGSGSVIALLKALAEKSGIPVGATPITAASGNVAAAAAIATLAGASSKTTYITGFTCSASGATSGLPVTVTVGGVITGTLSYTFTFPAGVLVGATPLSVQFPYPIPASATNTAVVVTLPSGGTGNTNATVTATGFQL